MIAERKTVLALVAVTMLVACSDDAPEEAVAAPTTTAEATSAPESTAEATSDSDDCGDRGAGVRGTGRRGGCCGGGRHTPAGG